MAFSDNNPTFKYVKISGLNIIHEGISYRINEIYSSSKYFYWDKNKSPNELITSNIRVAESASCFLICMNDRGIHTEVNHDELIYNFGGYTSGGGGGDISKTEFNALKVQVDENKEAYMNVSQSVDGIYQVVGDSEELEDGTIIKHINSLKQTSTSMDLKIQELNTKISDEFMDLRNRCTDSLVDLLASISTLKIDFEYFTDEEELSEEGKNTITTSIENTRSKLSTLKTVVDEILAVLSGDEGLEQRTDLSSAFNDLDTDVTNMLSIISRAISDDNISSDDITTVILAIGTATQKLNVLKATVEEIMTLGLGGTIYDSYSQIHVDNEKIRTIVKETESKVYGTLKSSSTEYYSSTSTDTLEGGGWQSTPPAWESGRYIWQRIKYEYASGEISYSTPVCIAGAKGDKGEDGSSVKILGSYDTYEELVAAHPLDNENGDAYLIQGDLYVWTGTQFENVGQIKGEDGESAHVHIKYSNDGGQTFTGNNGEDTGLYIGIYSDFSVTDSSDVNDYKWSLIKGEDGKDGLNGIDGINGKDGVSIIWKGTLTEHPSGAENGWAYYNSAQGKSFVYQDETWYQMTIDGADGIKGNDGADGLSIIWKGEQKTPPSRPETNWVYRDTDNGIVYIYNGSAWEAMTYDGSDGVDGTNGTDGLSIVWKGESSEPPSNAEENWVYRDTDDGIIYIYTEGEWVIMAVDGIDGVDGTNGINGSSLLIFTTNYSSNQSTIEVWSKEGYRRNWVVKEDITGVQAGDNALVKVNNSTRKFDCFIIVKVNSVNVNTSSINATSYGLVDKGEDGNDGLSVFITYHDSIEKPDLPTGDGTTNGWHTDTTDDTRWMSQKVALSAEEGTWGEPIKIKGEDGTSVKILGVYDSLEELLAEHPSESNQNGDGYLIDGELYVWNDNEFLNVGKIKGEDGTSMYLHVKYSNDGGQTFTGNNGEDEGTYIGTYADHEEADSMDVTKYKWVKFSPQSLIKSTPQWYLSMSKTNQTGGSWTETMPELKEGYYLWLRYKLDWENPTQTTYTTPILEQLYENMKEVIERQSTLEQDMNGFRTMVSETYATKGDVTDVEDYLTNNYTTTTEMKSMIDQSASQIKTSVSATYATISTVNTVSSTANSALSTANTANTNATNALNKANTNATNISTITTKQSTLEQTVNGFKTEVSNTYVTKGDASNTYATKSLVNQTASDWTATFNAGYNQGIVNMNANGITVQHGSNKSVLDSEALKFYEGSTLKSKVDGGVFKFTDSSGAELGQVGCSSWVYDRSKTISALKAEYGHSVALSAPYSSTATTSTVGVAHSSHQHWVDDDMLLYQGTNIAQPYIMGMMNFRPTWKDTLQDYSGTKIGHLTLWGATTDLGYSGYVAGNNLLGLCALAGKNAKIGLAIYEDSSYSGGTRLTLGGPLQMNGWSMMNARSTMDLNAQSRYTKSLLSEGSNENISYGTLSYSDNEIRWCWKENVFTYQDCDVDPVTDEWVYLDRYICYIELPVFMAENIEADYHINVSKMSWGDWRIREKNQYYFILESEENDFAFTFEVVAKLKDGATIDTNAYVANDSVSELNTEIPQDFEDLKIPMNNIQEDIIEGEE